VPNPGQVNNGGGVNGATLPGGAESPYGAVKRLTQATRAVPIGPAPGGNAPKQATRASQQGEPALLHPADAVAAPGQELPPAGQYAALWAAVAATPGASPLVQQIAQEAQRGTEAVSQ
jgi:hypothetical protein